MKLLGYIIIAISLCVGALATTTAYVPRLGAVEPTLDDADTRLTLNAPAGARKNDAGEVEENEAGDLTPLADRGATIDRALFDELQDNGVTRVRVKEFSFSRWEHSWMFGAAVAGLIVGGAMVKTAQRKEIARRAATTADSPESPEAAMASVRATIEPIVPLPGGPEKDERIVHEIGELQQSHLRVLSESRALLVGRLGMGGFARFMDRFSAMERQLNRAWSAAADGASDEADRCLRDAHATLPDVEARLKGR